MWLTIKRMALPALVLAMTLPVYGQTAQQDVTVVVEEINVVSVSSGSVTLTIDASTAGDDPDLVTNTSTSYSVTTNGENKKITAELDDAFAAGITLQASLAAPGSGASTGLQTLSTSASDLVTGLTRVKGSGLLVTYSASATVEAVPNDAGESRTVTFTITDA